MAKKTNNAENSGFEGQPGVWETMRETMRAQAGHHGPMFGRANFGQRGWLRPAVLRLLEEKPMNGMEMINRFYEASHGWWKPSPGSVYPLLETLESEAIIKKRGDGRYEMTREFREGLKHSGQVDEMLQNMEGSVTYLEEMSKADRQRFAAYRKRVGRISERLSKLK